MLIDARQKFLFIHVPKTGGTSIRQMLSSGNKEFTRNCKFHKRRNHITYNEVKLLIPDIDSYYSFAFVRNPWERAYSEWRWVLKIKKIRRFFPFVEFLKQVKKEVKKNIRAGGDHWRPQVDFLSSNISKIGRFEKFKEDILDIFTNIKIKNLKFEHLNETNRSDDWRLVFCQEALNIINEIWQPDIERFGYKWETSSSSEGLKDAKVELGM